MIVASQILLGLALVGSVYWGDATYRLIPASPAARFSGALLLLLSIGILLKARIDLGRSFRIHPRPHRDAVLVRRGIYSRLRHPMYTAVVLICGGTALAVGSLAVCLVALINVGFYWIKARYEEGLLRRRYSEYAAYQRESWGVFPFLR